MLSCRLPFLRRSELAKAVVSIGDDAKTAMRRIRRARKASWPIVVLALLAIGLNACMLSVIYGLLAKPLPYPAQERLVTLDLRSDKMGIDLGWSVPFFEAASDQDGLQQVAAFKTSEAVLLSSAGERVGEVEAITAQPALFSLLGLNATAGRVLNDTDSLPGMPCHIVVSEDFWERRFGKRFEDGRRLKVDEKDCMIVGTVPSRSGFPEPSRQLWMPLVLTEEDRALSEAGSFGDLHAVGRLAVGRSELDATREMMRRINTNNGLSWVSDQLATSAKARPLRYIWVGDRQFSLTLMMMAALIVFVVGTANICNLFVLGVIKRRHEFALMEAVGAKRARLLVQVAVEAVILSGIGAVCALLLVGPGLMFLEGQGFLPQSVPQQIGVDPVTVLAVLVMLCIIAGAMTLSAGGMLSQNLSESLRQGGNGQTSGRKGSRIRLTLVVAQITCTTVLLFGTALLIRSSNKLISEDVGFSREKVLVGQIGGVSQQAVREPKRVKSALSLWLADAQELPGVRAVALASVIPFSENASISTMRLKGVRASAEDINAYDVFVSENYFKALGLPILQGRNFTANETTSRAPSVIVDASFVSRYLPGEDAIGQVISINEGQSVKDYRIVGVVASARQRALHLKDEYSIIYRPLEIPYLIPDLPTESVAVIVSSPLPLLPLTRSLEQRLGRTTQALRLYDAKTMQEVVLKTLENELRLNMLLRILGVIAITLSVIGLYALLSFSVMTRTREFGVRMALGGDKRHIIGLVCAQGAKLFGIAMILAVPGVLLIARSLSDKLFKISPYDPISIAVVFSIFGLACMCANLIPSIRASRVAPMEALRGD